MTLRITIETSDDVEMLRYLLRAEPAGASVLVEDRILLADGGHEDLPPTLAPPEKRKPGRPRKQPEAPTAAAPAAPEAPTAAAPAAPEAPTAAAPAAAPGATLMQVISALGALPEPTRLTVPQVCAAMGYAGIPQVVAAGKGADLLAMFGVTA